MNWDHTGINIFFGCPWTMEEKDAKHVDCVELDNKWQITAVICATLSGIFLPIQLIYQGKTMITCLVTRCSYHCSGKGVMVFCSIQTR